MVLTSAQLPRFYTYADVVAHYDKVKPYRSGGDRGNRPLGNRRYKSCQLHKIKTEEEGEFFSLELYGYSVIKWFPNDIVHFSLCGWDTVSTRQFMLASTPYDVKHDRGVTYLMIGKQAYPFESGQATLKVDMRSNKVLNPAQEYTYKLDHKKFKQVKDKYGDFREYIGNMGKILTAINESELIGIGNEGTMQRVSMPTQGYARERKSVTTMFVSQYLESIEEAQKAQDLEHYYRLFLRLGVSCLSYHYHLKAYVRSLWDKDLEIATPMLKYFDELLKYVHRDEVFKVIAVPIGSKVSNVNRKYFN
jgi:hypothetical protein